MLKPGYFKEEGNGLSCGALVLCVHPCTMHGTVVFFNNGSLTKNLEKHCSGLLPGGEVMF